MSTTQQFEEAYQKLNPRQREAVDTIEGPVMVIAGPGTGKTQILTLRIANILRQVDIEPENILALTFTESGVASMRKRLASIIGTPAYSVTIATFHGFCNDIIKTYPEEFPRILAAKTMTEVDQIQLIERLVMEAPVQIVRPYGEPLHNVRAILAAINELKREGISPERFIEIVEAEEHGFKTIDDLYYETGAHKGKMKGKYQDWQKQIEKNKELAVLYHSYQQALGREKLYDYNDMIMEVLAKLQADENFRLILQEQYQYFLVDEHQDTNNAQNKILELLASFHPDPNLFVVGDEKQAIYKFQGASLENFLYFKNLYPRARLVSLEHNYRSTQTILDSAGGLMPQSQQLVARAGHPERAITLHTLNTPEQELFFIAQSIKDKIASGVKAGEIAVLYRENRDAQPIARMLARLGVPYVLESDQNILDDPDVCKFLLILRALNAFGSDAELVELLHIDFLKVPPLDIYKLANQRGRSMYDLVNSSDALAMTNIAEPKLLNAIADKLNRWQSLLHNSTLAETAEAIIRESGLLEHVLEQPNWLEQLSKIELIFKQIQQQVQDNPKYILADFIHYIDTLQEHGLALKLTASPRADGVRLMTAHRSKGLEFDVVYIAHAFDGHWGNKRRYQYFKLPEIVYHLSTSASNQEIYEDSDDPAFAKASADVKTLTDKPAGDDERNLFYVALTRARKEIIISYSQEGENGREQLASQFVTEIENPPSAGKPELIAVGDNRHYEELFDTQHAIVFAPPVAIDISAQEKTYLRELFERYGLSVTAINNYLKCPWQYFYTNLVRIPQAKSKHQMYGTAVHGALKKFFDELSQTDKPKPDKTSLVTTFKTMLDREPLNARDYEESLKKGNQALAGYYDTYQSTWRTNVVNELEVKGIELAPGVLIRGAIDKIEFLDTNQREVNVVDYKTAKPKTRGQIEGSTKDSDGDYKRQLVFYNLLLNHYQDGKYQMRSGEIDFIEPDDKSPGRYKKELFIITPEEVEALKSQVLRIADEIINFKFWDTTCNQKDCSYCRLRILQNQSLLVN